MAQTDKAPILVPVQAWWLLATSAIALASLAIHVAIWLPVVAVTLLIWRAWTIQGKHALPTRWLLLPLVALLSIVVIAQYGTFFGQNPGIALLILFMALKQMETKSIRDGLTIVFLAYFLALAQFFYSQTIPAASMTVLTTVIATCALASLTDPRPHWAIQIRRSLRLLLQATPFMLLLFILFPRIQGPLWGLPKDANSSLTGLSEIMSPGSISQLSQSDAVSFRVRFPDKQPERRQLYWRGPVLVAFDGRNWKPERERPRPELSYQVPEQSSIEQEITLEAHGKPWIFALEHPASLPPDTLMGQQFQLLAKTAVTLRQRYRVRSIPDLTTGIEESATVLEAALVLPPDSNPRLHKLAEQWRKQAATDTEILSLAKNFFLHQKLTYTLSPPLLGIHTGDEFVFDTKEGFCEHFANAFAIAMRAAGVPARIVTGYQGGEINPIDGFMTVRQSDAHAWTEVWLSGRGWTRVDPTAISAPARIDLNLAAAVPNTDSLPFLARSDAKWLSELRFRWDAISNAWNQWILGYTPERQRELLEHLGLSNPDWRQMTTILAVLSSMAMLILALWMLRQHQPSDPGLALWIKLSRRLNRVGLARYPWEGPDDYGRRVALALPDRAEEIRTIAHIYGSLRYGRSNPLLLDELRRRIRKFKS